MADTMERLRALADADKSARTYYMVFLSTQPLGTKLSFMKVRAPSPDNAAAIARLFAAEKHNLAMDDFGAYACITLDHNTRFWTFEEPAL